MSKGPISQFIEKNYLHFNSASLVDAAKAYEQQLANGAKMMVSMAGAMSTAEIGKTFAEIIRQDKVQIISCTGANLEEDIMNLVAHSHYERVPHYRDLTPEDEWALLFSRAYGSTPEKGKLLFRKYKLNKSRFCVLYIDSLLVAAYSGLELSFEKYKLFLSTDTMSDGTKKGASVLLGSYLYEQLIADNFLVVCGYPNDNIRKLRQNRLHWNMKGGLFLWFGVPLFWRFKFFSPAKDLWKVVRPNGGFFGNSFIGVNLLGRNGLFSNNLGVTLTLASKKPGIFFIRIPDKLFSTRTFGYRFLNESVIDQDSFLKAIEELDIETIDIP